MNVLIVGSGGREHALAWCCARSAIVDEVFVAPGNGGTARESNCANVNINVGDFEALAAFAVGHDVGLTIVGPEAPLVNGIREYFDARNLKCFAPTSAAAQLEGSKTFAKRFMQRHDIPTAEFHATSSLEEARAYVHERGAPIVVKADGLAAGKGVTVAQTESEALEVVERMLTGASFGDAGRKVVLEDVLEGEEASYIVMTDGHHILPFAGSQDHKPVFDGDRGPNTGGMGAYSPAPVLDEDTEQRVLDQIVRPTVAGMANEGRPFTGFLYTGLMIASSGEPSVVEFNCRFGDPEAQAVLIRLKSDLLALCISALTGALADETLEFDDRAGIAVVMAAEGYPASYDSGQAIAGVEAVHPPSKVFHAGTVDEAGTLRTSGGRVLAVTSLDVGIANAQRRVYEAVRAVSWPGAYFRTDIAERALHRAH